RAAAPAGDLAADRAGQVGRAQAAPPGGPGRRRHHAEEAASARFIPGLGVQFTEIEADEADRLEELLTALGIERVQAVVAPELRRTNPGRTGREEVPWAPPASRAPAARGATGDPEAILRDISEALEAEEAPLATSKPALPPQPAAPPPPNTEPH